jgi:Dockerin type I domain
MTHLQPILKTIKKRLIKFTAMVAVLLMSLLHEGMAQTLCGSIGVTTYFSRSEFTVKNFNTINSTVTAICPVDTSFSCAQLKATNIPTVQEAGEPKITTDCIYGSTYSYIDRYYDASCSQPFKQLPVGISATHRLPNTEDVIKIIIRSFTINDRCGSSTTCEQAIFIRTTLLKNVVCPKDTVFDCSKVPLKLDPSVTGVPQVDLDGNVNTINDRFAADQTCQIYLKYSDDTFRLCAGSYKIERTWSLISLCSPDDPATAVDESRKTCIQSISVLDKTPPSVSAQFSQYYVINSKLAVRDTTVDFDGYSITGGASFYGFRTHVYPLSLPNGCGGKVRLVIKANDLGCSKEKVTFSVDDIRVKELSNYPQFNETDRVTTSIFEGVFTEIGEYVFTIEAKDVCGYAISKKTFRILVRDNISPQAVCANSVSVSLNNDGSARIFADRLDGGSADNCAIDRIEVKRFDNCWNLADTLFKPYVDFYCCDAGKSKMVGLRVYDKSGLYNDCMMSINIDDRLKPSCIGPAPVTITCKDVPFNDYTQYGMPALWDNCGLKDTVYSVIKNLNNCGVGTITRKWVISDFTNKKDSCTQTISVTGKSDFIVDFPDDIVADCFAVVPSIDQAKNMLLTNPSTKDGHIVNNGCGTIFVEIKDDTLTSVPGACYMILRKFKVIDWCKFSFNNGSSDWNSSCYGQPVCEDIHSNSLWDTQNTSAWEFLNRSGCTINTKERRFRDADGLVATSTNPLITVNPNAYSDGVICFTQLINISDNTPPQFTAAADTIIKDGGLGCQATVNIIVKAEDQCKGVKLGSEGLTYNWTLVEKNNPSVIILRGSDSKITATLAYGKDYVANWIVFDRCGNQAFKTQNIKVIDAKTPAILCLNKNAELGGMIGAATVAVNVADVVQGVSDNCSSYGYLTSQLALVKTTSNTTNQYPSVLGTTLTFTCADAGKKIPVQIWTKDEAGNANYCISEITVQDNLGFCTPPATITGAIRTEADKTVNNVAVSVLQNNIALSSMTTSTTGAFSLTDLKKGQAYQVKASRNDNPVNGVTTFDIALISKHILGIQPLTSPYKLIAADVNKDGDVNASDMLLIRRMILKNIQTFPNNSSWRFVDKNFVFANVDNPFSSDFPEVVTLTNIPLAAQVNFAAIKVGDVNNSVNPSNFTGSSGADIQIRNANTLKFEVEDIDMKAGKEYEIVFKSENFNALGYQFTLNHTEGVELVKISSGTLTSMSDNNFGKFKNALTTSWNGITNDKNVEVFKLVLRSYLNIKLSEILTLGSNITTAEAYDKNGEMLDIELEFKSKSTVNTEGFTLNQNEPNPFDSDTKISFNIPKETQQGRLTIYDATGRIVKSIESPFKQGYNEFTIQRTELNTTGIFFYRIDTPTHSATKKMFVL